MTRLLKLLFLGICVALLAMGVFHKATAQPEGQSNGAVVYLQAQPEKAQTERAGAILIAAAPEDSLAAPEESLAEAQQSAPIQPVILFGLAASLVGAAVFWATVLYMARRRGY